MKEPSAKCINRHGPSMGNEPSYSVFLIYSTARIRHLLINPSAAQQDWNNYYQSKYTDGENEAELRISGIRYTEVAVLDRCPDLFDAHTQPLTLGLITHKAKLHVDTGRRQPEEAPGEPKSKGTRKEAGCFQP